MDRYRKTSLALVAVLGPAVLLSYLQLRDGGAYLSSKYWLGLDRPLVVATVIAQVLAAAGFIAFVGATALQPPRRGIMRGWGLPVAIAVLLVASGLWAPCVRHAMDHGSLAAAVGTSVCLVAAAVAALLMLAGVFESDMGGVGGTVALVGIALLGVVVVLLDGVGWNARWIHRRPWA